MAALAGDAVSEEAAQAARNNAVTQQGVEHLAAVRAPDPAPTPDAPFSLLFKPGLPARYTQGALGVRLGALVGDSIEQACVITGGHDPGWLFTECPDLRQASTILIISGPGKALRLFEKFKCQVPDLAPKLHYWSPNIERGGMQHSKVLLLKYATGLRVVITSANLTERQFNNMTQTVFWQDFAKKDEQSPQTSRFEDSLRRFLHAFIMPDSVVGPGFLESFVLPYDFGSARACLIAAGPLLMAPHGRLAFVWLTRDEMEHCMEVWPGSEKVLGISRDAAEALRPFMCRWGEGSCGRDKVVPHSKIYLRCDSSAIAWCYVGSANISKSAWGFWQGDGFTCLNFELGALLLPSLEAAYRASRWFGFSCTATEQPVPAGGSGSQGQAQPGATEAVQFAAWRLGANRAAQATVQGSGMAGKLQVPLPVPFRVPPPPYQDDERDEDEPCM